MRTIKLLLFFVTFSAVSFYSCSDSDPISNPDNTQQSIALRTALNELKVVNNMTGRTAANNPMCFEFVFPITFSYNNGTLITVANLDGLIEILTNETLNLYLSGVVFPFNVAYQGMIQTISNEEEFTNLLEVCGYTTWNDDLQNTFCFDFIYPISFEDINGEVIVINSAEALVAYLSNLGNGNEAQLIFPISVLYNNEIVVIQSHYEFYEMVNNCNTDICICTEQYDPVCVETANGIMEFGNMCFAVCAGYTQNDFVACNASTGCDISNLNVEFLDCNPDGSYPLTINFTYSNASSSSFVVHNSANQLIGEYLLTSLPLTFNSYAASGQAVDYLTVNIAGNTNCSAAVQWNPPSCSNCNCPTSVEPVCVTTASGEVIQFDNMCLAECVGYTVSDVVDCVSSTYNFGTLLGSCFTMAYPVQVQFQGALVTVNSDEQLLQYYNPAFAPMPAFNYPVTIIYATNTQTAGSQDDFEYLNAFNCY